MFRNYLKIAIRSLLKHPLYALINILGLSVGMVCFFFIFLYVKDELSYDRYHANIDRLYRLNFYAKLGEQLAHTAGTPKPAGPMFKQDIPEIESYCRLRSWGDFVVRYDNQSFKEEKVIFADSTLFRVFSFKLLEGDASAALTDPNSVVITKTAAEKYFGQEDPLGKVLMFGETPCKVTGLMEDIPENSHFHFDFFRPVSSINLEWDESWGNTNYYNYFLLRKGADPAALSQKATDIFVGNFSTILKDYLHVSWEEFREAGNYARVEFFPVRDIHLHSDLDKEPGVNGDVKYVYIFSIIGLFILALACINFMNLATARSAVRAKEVGVRKAVGALRGDLAGQFLSESLAMSAIAMIVAVAGMYLLLPAFNALSGKALELTALLRPGFALSALLTTVLIGFAAGSYPAFFLSSFQLVHILKNRTGFPVGKSGGKGFRNGLVVFQFFTTIVLLIGSMVVYRQLRFIQDKKLGFEKENVLVLRDIGLLDNRLAVFKERMLQNHSVISASASSNIPATIVRNTGTVIKGRNASQENSILSNNWWVDFDFVKTMGLEMAEGRDFSKDIATDSTAVLINETFARSLGYPQQPVEGQEISFVGAHGEVDPHTIVGVVKDFNFTSLRTNIEPVALFRRDQPAFLSFRFKTTDLEGLIREFRKTWDEMAPAQPFEYTFLDERFDRLYDAETRVGEIMSVFACIAVFIACIGLLGLATFTVQQRTKEIGVRKVLGASTYGIVSLLSKDFLKLVLVALLLAAPTGYYFMYRWLQDFAYRIEIPWYILALAGVTAVAVTFLTISFQSIRAAWANPVKSLRSE